MVAAAAIGMTTYLLGKARGRANGAEAPPGATPQTGSGFILGDGTHLVTNWHVVACTREGGQALVLASGFVQANTATARGTGGTVTIDV